MKKVIFAIAVLGAAMAISSCEKMGEIIGDGDSGQDNIYVQNRKGPETLSVRLIENLLADGTWTVRVGKYDGSGKLADDTLVTRRLQEPEVSIYPMETTYVEEAKMTSETFGPNGTAEGKFNAQGVASIVQNYVHNLDVKKDMELAISYERGRLEIWGLVVESPEIKANLAYGEKVIPLEAEATKGDYAYYIGTMTYDLTINGQSEKVVGRQRIGVAKDPGPGPGPEPEEEINCYVIDSGYTWINSTTWLSWGTIQRISSKTGTTTFRVQVNCNNGILAPDGEEKVVSAFDQAQKSMAVGAERMVGSRVSGDFTITTWHRQVTTGSESISKAFTLLFEKPILHLQRGDSIVEYAMPYPEYKDISDEKFSTSDLSDQTDGGVTYSRKRYKYAMKAAFIEHQASASSDAILKVVKAEPEPEPEPEEPRVTPSWLGDGKWGKYTRVQRAYGAQFEDMLVFGYENGVVMAPNGVPDLKNGVFAYTDADAAKYGVERCAKGACYSGVWTGSKWIPAKILDQDGRWLYTGLYMSHTVHKNNATTIGIGKSREVIPGNQETKVSKDGKITIYYSKGDTSLSPDDLDHVSLK